MTYKSLTFWLLGLSILCLSCGESKKGAKSNEFLPNVSLVPHELLVVMDSTQWKGVLGDAVRDVFAEPLPGLPQEEAQFTVRYLQPKDFRGFHKRYPNILFVFTLDNKSRATQLLQSMFSQKSLEQIKQDPQRYQLTRQNEFAKGQEVMYLFANSEDQLTNRLYSNKQQLLAYFQGIERNRYLREFASIKSTKAIGQTLSKQYGFTMNFPKGYEIAKQDSNFVWIRLLDNQVDKSVWVTWQPFDKQEQLKPENFLDWRNSIVKNHIWGNDASTYMRLETEMAPTSKEVNFNQQYAMETRGLWRLEKMAMGGPFVSYAFVDEASSRIYYIEGFTYAPGQKKREAISELEAILWSFKRTDNQKK